MSDSLIARLNELTASIPPAGTDPGGTAGAAGSAAGIPPALPGKSPGSAARHQAGGKITKRIILILYYRISRFSGKEDLLFCII